MHIAAGFLGVAEWVPVEIREERGLRVASLIDAVARVWLQLYWKLKFAPQGPSLHSLLSRTNIMTHETTMLFTEKARFL